MIRTADKDALIELLGVAFKRSLAPSSGHLALTEPDRAGRRYSLVSAAPKVVLQQGATERDPDWLKCAQCGDDSDHRFEPGSNRDAQATLIYYFVKHAHGLE